MPFQQQQQLQVTTKTTATTSATQHNSKNNDSTETKQRHYNNNTTTTTKQPFLFPIKRLSRITYLPFKKIADDIIAVIVSIFFFKPFFCSHQIVLNSLFWPDRIFSETKQMLWKKKKRFWWWMDLRKALFPYKKSFLSINNLSLIQTTA